jgi:hypothetical protein
MGVSSATTSVLRMIVCRVLKTSEDYADNYLKWTVKLVGKFARGL